MARPGGQQAQLVRRIPSYQPAVLMLVLVGAAALNIYAQPPAVVRIPTLAIGLLCGGLAVAALRLQLVATDDGIAVRRLVGEQWLAWPELAEVEVVPNVRGAPTVRLNRVDGSYVDVPPSLLQPTKPTAKHVVMRNLDTFAGQLEQRRRAYRRGG
jgi:hypothetical protein